MAQTRPAWLYAYVATTLSFYCGLRACEIKALRWRDVQSENALIEVRRSKTPAGWRSPTLNATCQHVLRSLHDQAATLSFTKPDHFVFPWHGRSKNIDPTRGMTSWRTAWHSIRKAAGLTDVRFHDGRHTAITTLAEKGLPDWVIQAQVGQVAPQMMKTYSHIRREALNQAAAALEPASTTATTPRRQPNDSPPSATGCQGLCHNPCHKTWIRKVAYSIFLGKLAPQAGFEPATLRLTAGCSAVELLRNKGKVSRLLSDLSY